MAIIAQDLNYVEDFSLMEDSGDDKTIFQIGAISTQVRAWIDDTHLIVSKETGAIDDTMLHDKYIQFVKFGLRGWKNFKDANGTDVPFSTTEQNIPRLGKISVVSNECIDRLQLRQIVEIGLAIITLNQMGADKSKNS